MRRFWYVAAIVAALIPVKAQADMGLKCSEWLEGRRYIRYDAQTKQFRDERPRTVPPVNQEVETKIIWAGWYLSGHVNHRVFLDKYLAKVGAAVDVAVAQANPVDETIRGLESIDNLCRNGLQKEHRDYDVATIIDLIANSVLAQRLNDITTMIEHATEIGRRLGARPR
jgi:hypothetical protein